MRKHSYYKTDSYRFVHAFVTLFSSCFNFFRFLNARRFDIREKEREIESEREREERILLASVVYDSKVNFHRFRRVRTWSIAVIGLILI